MRVAVFLLILLLPSRQGVVTSATRPLSIHLPLFACFFFVLYCLTVILFLLERESLAVI